MVDLNSSSETTGTRITAPRPLDVRPNRHTCNLEMLKNNRIQDIVNVSKGAICYHSSKLNYFQIPCGPDDAYETLCGTPRSSARMHCGYLYLMFRILHLDTCFEFIEVSREDGAPVLIQCQDGITLAPGMYLSLVSCTFEHRAWVAVVAAAYLMKKCNAPAREALEYIEQSFPRVLIDGVWATRFKVDDSKFIDVLCEYEKGGVGYKSVLTHAPPPSKVCD